MWLLSRRGHVIFVMVGNERDLVSALILINDNGHHKMGIYVMAKETADDFVYCVGCRFFGFESKCDFCSQCSIFFLDERAREQEREKEKRKEKKLTFNAMYFSQK